MAGKKNELGTTGETVAANVLRLRTGLNLKYAEVSRRLEAVGRPIPVLGVSRIEAGERRVDADDLMALAAVFGVSPATLLMPLTSGREELVTATAAAEPTTAARLWEWIRAEHPLGWTRRTDETKADHEELESRIYDFWMRAMPPWRTDELFKGAIEIARLRERSETRGND